MKKVLTAVIVALALLASGGCARKARVIPAGTLADIYAEMFMADQWLQQNSRYRRTADTTNFYAPIFEKYGYTVEDYDASVRHYLHKPDNYAKILKHAGTKLSKEEKRLQAYEDALKKQAKFSPYIPSEFRYDTLRFRDDSLGLWPNDSSFVVPDTLAVGDTLAVVDSLAVADSLAVVPVDSLALSDTTIIHEIYEPETDSSKVLLLYGPDDAPDRGHALLRKDSDR